MRPIFWQFLGIGILFIILGCFAFYRVDKKQDTEKE